MTWHCLTLQWSLVPLTSDPNSVYLGMILSCSVDTVHRQGCLPTHHASGTFLLSVYFAETESLCNPGGHCTCYASQVGLEALVFLPQPAEAWGYRQVPSRLASMGLFLGPPPFSKQRLEGNILAILASW